MDAAMAPIRLIAKVKLPIHFMLVFSAMKVMRSPRHALVISVSRLAPPLAIIGTIMIRNSAFIKTDCESTPHFLSLPPNF